MNVKMKIFFNRFFGTNKELKIVVGSGGITPQEGWIATDISTLDVTKKEDWMRLSSKGKVSNVFAEHVWEHLTPEQASAGNSNIFSYLKPGGRFRVAVPDGFNPDQSYIDHVKPGGTGPGAHDHKLLYNYKTLTESLAKHGFKIELLEYWDENGHFHHNNWSTDHGKVLRSRDFDTRNKEGVLKYTSLIADAIKP